MSNAASKAGYNVSTRLHAISVPKDSSCTHQGVHTCCNINSSTPSKNAEQTFLAATLYPAFAYAHVGVGETSGFVHGFSHPISGLDHVLAMILVGILAFQLGARALWLVPLSFVGMMAVGGALGVTGVNVPFVELGIASSVIVLGAAIAFGIKAPVAIAASLAGLFAIFHGHAHGAEMPDSAGELAYAGGFMMATGLLHIAGIGLGLAVSQRVGPTVVRVIGAVAALAGPGILTGAL